MTGTSYRDDEPVVIVVGNLLHPLVPGLHAVVCFSEPLGVERFFAADRVVFDHLLDLGVCLWSFMFIQVITNQDHHLSDLLFLVYLGCCLELWPELGLRLSRKS